MILYIILQSGKMRRKVIGIVQARSDSSRLPGKVLKLILNKPMIIHQLERTNKSSLLDELILITSDEKSDDTLATIISDNSYNIFRGDKQNVLKRFYDSIQYLNLDNNDIIVRLTGDCPLHDAKIIDESISKFQKNKVDYLANCINPIYPDGLDVEVFNYKALKYAYFNATKISDLEHVTPYIRNSKKFITYNLRKKAIHPNWRLTVDEENDLELIEKIYTHFNHNNFSFNDIINFLKKNTELLSLNSTIQRNEGYKKSLEKESNAR